MLPRAALLLPIGHRNHLPELAFSEVVGCRAGSREEQQFFLDVRRKIHQRGDLREPRRADVEHGRKCGVAGHAAASDHCTSSERMGYLWPIRNGHFRRSWDLGLECAISPLLESGLIVLGSL